MPVHNAAGTRRQAVRSAQAQTHTEWELLAVDDASDDESWELLSAAAAADERVVPIRSTEPLGAAVARNRAIERARGSWVAFLDSDDLWLPGKLERQLAFGAETGAPLTYSWYYKVGADSAGDAVDFQPNDRVIRAPGELTYRRRLRANYNACLTAMQARHRLCARMIPELRRRQCYEPWT